MQVHILPGSENNIVIEWKTNLCYIPFYKFEKCKDDDIVQYACFWFFSFLSFSCFCFVQKINLYFKGTPDLHQGGNYK
jgi:hypothetical protein